MLLYIYLKMCITFLQPWRTKAAKTLTLTRKQTEQQTNVSINMQLKALDRVLKINIDIN